MKYINKDKLKKYIHVVAIGLVMIVAVSGVLGIVLNIDNHNGDINNGRDTLTRCDVWGHEMVVEQGKSATCQEDGYTTAKYCANCDFLESEKVVLSKLNAHKPVYVNGVVTCEFCNKAYGSNYYYATDFLSTEDTFADGEYVTLEGTVVLKGCSSGGKYYLLLAGDRYNQVIRVDFDTSVAILPFVEGSVYSITGTVDYVSGNKVIRNVDAYTCVSENGHVRDVYSEDYLRFDTIEADCRANREDYFCKLIYVEAPYLSFSTTTGAQSNFVRFDNGEDVVDSKSEYFSFSLKYLREFTSFTNGSVVTFGDVTVKHKDKAPVQDAEHGFYVYLLAWGSTSMEFCILDHFEWDVS